jgi:hypothetical protein
MLLVLAGCGRSRTPCVPVSGQVLLDGKPVSAGFIRLIPEKGRPASGTLDADGRFRLATYEDGDGCILGTHTVVISEPASDATKSPFPVPKKYTSLATSGYKVTIEKATDSLQIDLVSGGEKP